MNLTTRKLLFTFLGAVAVGWACGKSGGSGTCTAGQTQACTCTGGGSGTQTCLSDGSAYGTCQCQSQNDSGTTPDSGNTTPDSGNTTPDSGNTQRDSGPPPMCDGGLCCGNGVLDPGEDCDDGNRLNLDGCDSTCHYEVIDRITAFTIATSAAPSFCNPTTNAFGSRALGAAAAAALQGPIATDIGNGKLNILAQITGMTDYTGASSQSGLSIGLYSGAPDPTRGTYPNGNPIDWWFLADPTNLSNGSTTDVLGGGALSSRNLSAGPSTLTLSLPLGSTPANLQLNNAAWGTTINATPPPTTPAPPPSSLRSGTTVFQTLGNNTTNTQGICGNITVSSLAQIPVPQLLSDGGSFACGCQSSAWYTYCGSGNPVGPGCNSMLDVIISGCKVNLIGCDKVVTATQPDVAGNGGTVTPLTAGAGNKVTVPQGDNDAYSSYLEFTANRVHLTGQTCSAANQCQTGQVCDAGRCQ
jgi:cysteine-rich repeat protein